MSRPLKEVRACEVCGALFHPWASRPGRFCGTKCSAIGARGLNPWRPEENEKLEDWCGVYSFPQIVKKLQSVQRRNGWQVRTKEAISTQIKRLKLSTKRTLDNFSAVDLAQQLGVSPYRVRHWITHRELPYRAVSRQARVISLKEFRAWAVQNAHLLNDIDADRLRWAVEDETIVTQILSTERRGSGRLRPVKRLDTGQIFPSIVAAAKAHHISPAAIRGGILAHRPCCDIRFEFVSGF